MHELEKLIAKKKKEGKGLDKNHAKAKSSVLEELMDNMTGMGSEKVKGLKKVTVASDSPKGLEAGLEKAKELVSKKEEMEESPEHEMSESEEEEESEHSEESPEEIEAKIAELKAKLEQLKA